MIKRNPKFKNLENERLKDGYFHMVTKSIEHAKFLES